METSRMGFTSLIRLSIIVVRMLHLALGELSYEEARPVGVLTDGVGLVTQSPGGVISVVGRQRHRMLSHVGQLLWPSI